MKLFGWDISRTKVAQPQTPQPFEQVLSRLIGEGFGTNVNVTPESCMRSPTVHAIVTAVSRRISVSPPKVYRRVLVEDPDATGDETASTTRERKERQPNHPVEKLLCQPNEWQTRVDYWLDASSRLLRYGNYWAYLSRGATGPIRTLIPLRPDTVQVYQDLTTWAVTYKVLGDDTPFAKLHHVRGASRYGVVGDSPITDVSSAIALEIAAEQFGTSFFANGAMPLMIFKYIQGTQGFKSAEDERQFIDDMQNALTGNKRYRGLLLPKGIDTSNPIITENDKAQMLETRRYQRTVIAGAFGVPPHLVGDLERATFNNVEQQSVDFTVNVVAPFVRSFEASCERDLLTQDDRNRGIIIRFDLDSMQLVDFKSRQEGMQIQRLNGVISPNDWRERENMNPIPEDDGGEEYIRPLNYAVAGEPLPQVGNPAAAADAPPKPAKDDTIEKFRAKCSELASLIDRLGKKEAPVIINQAAAAAPVVNFYQGETHNHPPAVKNEITIEAPKIQVLNPPPAPPIPMDIVPERGADGRVVAIRHVPSKGKS